jgi:hypothetical protein
MNQIVAKGGTIHVYPTFDTIDSHCVIIIIYWLHKNITFLHNKVVQSNKVFCITNKSIILKQIFILH